MQVRTVPYLDVLPSSWNETSGLKQVEDITLKNVLFCRFIQSGAKRTHVFDMGSSRESFFLWGYLKSKVYIRKPRTVDDLKVSIREKTATVPQEMLVNVMQNFEERLRTCVRQEGRHLSDIIFRYWVINVKTTM